MFKDIDMRRHHAWHSHWCVLFEFHLKRKRLTATAFAALAKRSQQSVHDYLVGKVRPPPDLMPVFADALGLRGTERDQFILSAWEAWTPEPVWKRLAAIEHKTMEPREPSKTEQELSICTSVVANLVAILQDVEALFYTRTVPVHKLRERREEIGLRLRGAIERYARP